MGKFVGMYMYIYMCVCVYVYECVWVCTCGCILSNFVIVSLLMCTPYGACVDLSLHMGSFWLVSQFQQPPTVYCNGIHLYMWVGMIVTVTNYMYM